MIANSNGKCWHFQGPVLGLRAFVLFTNRGDSQTVVRVLLLTLLGCLQCGRLLRRFVQYYLVRFVYISSRVQRECARSGTDDTFGFIVGLFDRRKYLVLLAYKPSIRRREPAALDY